MVDPEDTEIKDEIDKIAHDIDTIIKNITSVVPLKDTTDPSSKQDIRERESDPAPSGTRLR